MLAARAAGAASFGGLACLGGTIGIADVAGGGDRPGDLGVSGRLPPVRFGGRAVWQEVEFTLAIHKDRDQHLAVVGEQEGASGISCGGWA